MKRIVMGLVAVVALAGVVTLPAYGQKKDANEKQTRSVQGVVTNDGESPLEGAVVQLKDTKTLQIRSFITKQNGTFHFHGLNPDLDYELKAEHQGAHSGSKTLSSFDSRKSAVINLKIDK
jgi:Carboxypeptidase regulatory-like domain